MRHYEIVFLVHPDQSDQVSAMVDRFREMVTSGSGSVHRVEDWGRRRLAYMINDVHKAHYVMANIECDIEALREIERSFKFNDSILRHLVIRRKYAITEESAMAKTKARETAEEAVRESQSETGDGDEKETINNSEAIKTAHQKDNMPDAEDHADGKTTDTEQENPS